MIQDSHKSTASQYLYGIDWLFGDVDPPSHILLYLGQQIAPQVLAVHRVRNVRGEEARLRAAVVALALELESIKRL